MKKLFAVMIACTAIIICCTKDPSLSNTHNVSLVTVDGASSNMIVSANNFTAADWLSVDYAEAADSIGWWVSDTLTNPYDTVPYYPGGDTIINYPDTSVYNPGDTTIYPGGDTIVYYPPVDTTHYPHDTITLPPYDSTQNNNGYIVQVNGSHIKIKISKCGSYTMVAFAYRKNANGGYTLIKTGYVKLSAH